MKLLVIWDIDGTLTRSKPGIFESYRYAARQSGIPVPTDDVLETMCCGDLYMHIFQLFGKKGEEAAKLADDYRWHYAEVCSKKVRLFDGIGDVLEEFRNLGATQAVATMNEEKGAITLLDRLGIGGYFAKVAGADVEGRRTKSQMITDCMSTGDYERVVMVGDCPGDRKAAEEAGAEFVAAAFGYGFPEEKCIRDGIPFAKSPRDLIRILNP